MSVPPPGGWQPPYQAGPPPDQSQPHGQPGFTSQQPPPGWQQGNWPQQPAGPPNQNGNNLKWLLIGVAVLLVIGITVGATLVFTRDTHGGGPTTATSDAPNNFASATDVGPVAIVTDEPTCQTFIGINNNLASIEANGWTERRNSLGAAQDWTDEDRSQVQTVATAIKNASDQMAALAKLTPHRVVRELYQQAIIYGRLYAERISNYSPKDNFLADVFVNGSSAIAGMCTTATNGSAGRSIGIDPAAKPSSEPALDKIENPERFVPTPNSYCTKWIDREKKFVADTAQWAGLDASIPSAQWSPEQRDTQLAALPIFQNYADEITQAGPESGNLVFEDFALTAALYLRAYIASNDSYTNADSWLYYTAFRLSNTVTVACQAVG